MNRKIYGNCKLTELEKHFKNIYEEAVSKNEISAPLPKKVLQKIYNECLDELSDFDVVNKEFKNEMKETENYFKSISIKDLTTQGLGEDEAKYTMDATHYMVSAMKTITNTISKLLVTAKNMDLDMIKNIRKEIKDAK